MTNVFPIWFSTSMTYCGGTRWNGVFLAEAGRRERLADHPRRKRDCNRRFPAGQTRTAPERRFDARDESSGPQQLFGHCLRPKRLAHRSDRNGHGKERELSNPERSLSQLWRDHTKNWRDARVELNQRFAFPVACFVFALIAVPLGSQPRRGGRAAGTLLAVLVIGAYYLLFIFGASLARQGAVPPWVGMWAANVLLALIGVALLPRMERYRGEVEARSFLDKLVVMWRLYRRRRKTKKSARMATNGSSIARVDSSVQRMENGSVRADSGTITASSIHTIIDLYVLRRFFYNFMTVMAIFILLFQTFTFFELLDDIARHHIPFFVVVNYFRYLMPYLLYQLTPLGALVAVLVTFGVMSKNNEIIAFKASGISLYRLTVPVLLAGALLAGTLFILDSTYLPYANQRQDALRNQIKGKPPQTYTRPQRWIFGENSKIYNYDLVRLDAESFWGVDRDRTGSHHV